MKIEVIKKHIKTMFNQQKEFNKSLLFVAIFMVLAIALPGLNILFEIKPTVSNFDKVIISNASINNLDIVKRVGIYTRFFIYITLGSLVLFYLLKRFYVQKIKNSDVILIAKNTSVLGILAVITSVLMFNSDGAIYWIVILLLLLLLGAKNENSTALSSIVPLLVSLPFTVLIVAFVKSKNIEKLNQPLLLKGISFEPYTIIFCLATVFFSLVFYFLWKNTKTNSQSIYTLSIPIIATIPVLTFLFEAFNILNKRFQIVINSPFLSSILVLFLGFALSFYWFKKNKTLNNGANILVGTYVLAIALLMCLPYRIMYPPYEFFETANHGIAIDHLIKYGKIPFLENFDAHMMQQQFFSYIYILFNGYEPFAPSLYIQYFYVIEIVVLYFVLNKALGQIQALVLLIGLPSIGLILNEFALGGLMLLVLFKTIKNPTFKNYLWFWISGFTLCFYKLDVGYAALLSGIFLLFLFNKKMHDSFYIKDIFKSAVYVVAPIGLLFVVLCLFKGINPISRLQEFLMAAMSDQNWAITKMGDQSHYLFRTFYYILPLFATIIVLFVVTNKVFLKAKITLNFLLLGALFYYLFFIFNAQRGIVFHNFEYGNLIRITSTIFVSFLFLALYFDKKKQLIYFSTAFFCFFLILNSSNDTFKEKYKSLLVQSIHSPSFHEKFLDLQPSNTRVKYSYSLAEIEYFKKFLDATLPENETYYDFSSANMIYTLVNRVSPSYVNQTPMMLNGIKAQELELQKIKDNDIKVVLMPIKNNYWHAISEVYIDFKYYKLAEYFYANFKPLYRNSLFDVYVRKDKFTAFNSKFLALGNSNANVALTDFSILNDASIIKNNIALENQSGNFVLKSSGAQAYFIGFIEKLRQNNSFKNENLPSKLVFKVEPKEVGNVKLYWKLNPTDNFAEESSKTYELIPNQNQELVLELNKIPNELMVAVNTPTLPLKEFSVVSDSKSSVDKPERIDYFIGFVPYLWGEKSKDNFTNKLQENKDVTEESFYKIAVKTINKNLSGTYLCMELESADSQTISVEIEKNNEVKATYGISVLKGRHYYQFKLSNNYYWWNLDQFNVNIKTPLATKAYRLGLLSEDEKDKVIYKSNGLSFSNLTDENWTKGVSQKFNMVLLDFAPSKEKMISKAKKIKLKDGTILPIQGYQVSGTYIQVFLNSVDIAKINTFGTEPIEIELLQ